MTTTDESAILALIDRWVTATKAGDIDTVLDLMTEDVVFMVAGRPPFGRAQFADAAKAMKGMSFEGENRIEELTVAGDLAYARVHLRVRVTPPGGAAVERSGYALSIYHRCADGRWRLARDANMVTTG